MRSPLRRASPQNLTQKTIIFLDFKSAENMTALTTRLHIKLQAQIELIETSAAPATLLSI